MADLDKINSQLSSIKDIDAAQLTQMLSAHKNPLIILVIIIGSLLAGAMMWNDYGAKDKALHTQMSQGQDKLVALKGRDAAKQDFDNFKSTLSKKLDDNQLITLISNYAKKCHITINSLSPTELKSTDLYDVINFNFIGDSYTYKDMMMFLREIEKPSSPLRIDSWSGHKDDTGKITFTIGLSAVFIHI